MAITMTHLDQKHVEGGQSISGSIWGALRASQIGKGSCYGLTTTSVVDSSLCSVSFQVQRFAQHSNATNSCGISLPSHDANFAIYMHLNCISYEVSCIDPGINVDSMLITIMISCAPIRPIKQSFKPPSSI
ncbi:hypothetical protein BDZ89DRAFT_648972 [Hymenopellis radicata]|nr:hypothetical protein BDZ89DRAFT_648972 [Hymenopellis radicata]